MTNKKQNNKKFNKSSTKDRKGNLVKKDKVFAADDRMNDQYNDISWWANNPQLVRDNASLPFNLRLGTPLSLFRNNVKILEPTSVMQIRMAPSIGCPSTKDDATNVAAKLIYSYVRHQNSGSANYEESDLMMMMVAYASAVSVLEAGKRAYGTIFTYSAYNTAVPDDLIIAMGFDPVNVRENISQFRALINYYSRKISAIRIPKGWPIAERWRTLNESYYLDEDSHKAQIYVPLVDRYLVWNAKAMSTGSCLERRRFPAKMTISDWGDIMSLLTERLINDEEIGIMSGDIIKAYGMENTMDIPMIADDYTTTPLRSAEFLTAIHNAHFNALNDFISTEGHAYIAIYQQEDGAIVEDNWTGLVYELNQPPYGNSSQAAIFAGNPKNRRILDLYQSAPTAEAVLLATRFAGPTAEYRPAIIAHSVDGSNYFGSAEQVSTDGYTGYRLTHGGSEILTDISFIKDGLIDGTAIQILRSPDSNGTLTYGEVREIADIMNFNYAPIIYSWSIVEGQDDYNRLVSNIEFICAQLDTFTEYSEDSLARMNDMAMLSAFTKTAGTAV